MNWKRFVNKSCYLPGLLLIHLAACSPAPVKEFYSLEDFAGIKKFDVHAHSLTAKPEFVEQAKADNFTLISMNVEVPDYPPLDTQQAYILRLRRNYPNDIYCVTAFETATMDKPGWSDRQIAYIKRSVDSGAVGVKVWKNIGMTIRDKDSNFIMIDDPVFDPVFNYMEQNNIPLIGHIGEPKNCWLPLEQMTTRNDSAYFAAHPQYHMYLLPGYPSYEKIIGARDHLLQKHPKLKFVGAHFGSMEWDVDEIAKRLDKYPLMMVEPAERLGQLQYQSIENWQKVHDFYMKYQDRILYGTDLEAVESQAPGEIKKHAHEVWTRDWQYFTSGDSLQSRFVLKKFKGLQLPRAVIDKMYFKNAQLFYFSKKG